MCLLTFFSKGRAKGQVRCRHYCYLLQGGSCCAAANLKKTKTTLYRISVQWQITNDGTYYQKLDRPVIWHLARILVHANVPDWVKSGYSLEWWCHLVLATVTDVFVAVQTLNCVIYCKYVFTAICHGNLLSGWVWSKESETRNIQQCGLWRERQALIKNVNWVHWLYLGLHFLQTFWPWIQKYSQQLPTFAAENKSLRLKSVLAVGHEASAMWWLDVRYIIFTINSRWKCALFAAEIANVS